MVSNILSQRKNKDEDATTRNGGTTGRNLPFNVECNKISYLNLLSTEKLTLAHTEHKYRDSQDTVNYINFAHY